MKITIDTKEFENMDTIFDHNMKMNSLFLSEEAEDFLLEILEWKEKVDGLYEKARERMKEEAEKRKGFKSIKSKNIKISYRFFGSKYKIDDSKIDQIPKEFYKKSVRYNPKAREIDDFVEEKGKLPFGVDETKRHKQLNFKKND